MTRPNVFVVGDGDSWLWLFIPFILLQLPPDTLDGDSDRDCDKEDDDDEVDGDVATDISDDVLVLRVSVDALLWANIEWFFRPCDVL